jgi:flagellin-like hook-associated protein FlgL
MNLSISGIPTSNISDMYVQQQLLDELNANQTDMLNIENELSTGKSISVASQDPIAAMRIMNLQSQLSVNQQIATNISTNQAYMTTTDSAMSSIANLLSEAQSTALSVMGTNVTGQQRDVAADQIQQDIQALMNIGNQKFNDRYLFAGSNTTVAPFTTLANGDIQYNGNNQELTSFSDANTQFDSNVTGDDAFGAVSAPVDGADLNPIVTADTKLSDLRLGQGISLGSIAITDGDGHQSIVDLSGAQTVGDVANLISANAPPGRTLQVTVTNTGLDIQLVPAAGQSDALSISEVGGGVTANELGILGQSSNGTIQGGALNPALTLTTPLADVDGGNLDLTSGLQITNGGTTYTVNLSQCQTIEDVLNAINGAGAGVTAQINPDQTGLEVSSNVSGDDFAIGENGGWTATDLGLRTFNLDTPLASLNYGQGVGVFTGDPNSNTPPSDFTITAADGDQFNVSLVGCNTVGDVINKIDDLSDGTVQARLVPKGNGIELVDDGPSPGQITIMSNIQSTAAVDLGLIPAGEQSVTSAAKGTASGVVSWGEPNSDLLFQANEAGTAGDARIDFVDDAPAAGDETADYYSNTQTLVIHIAPGTDANQVITAVETSPTASPVFSVSLDNAPNNNGSGTITPTTAYIGGGTEAVITGTDANPQETAGVFNSLLRMSRALQSNDMTEVQRDVNQLTQASQNLNFSQATLAAGEQGLSAAQTQLTSNNTQLQQLLSNDDDADMATVISDLTAAQTAFEASLEAMAQTFKMTLLNYL